ncbi:MAG TPA: hypothetical protein VFQ35_18140 [Polyangiaceae bacterium]|nr:hypothetical protein [Polyangiaceae bacterium]
MKNRLIATTVLGSCLLASGVLWLSSRVATASPNAPRVQAPSVAASPPAQDASAKSRAVALGEHLVLTAGCHDCHTPLKVGDHGPEPDMSRQLSGHPESIKLPRSPAPSGPWIVSVSATNTAWSGPWGVSFTANLTSDKDTGLGSWSKDMFIQTIRTGRHMGRGRPLLPPMPVPVYNNFSDEELGAIFAYLQTVPAIKNRVPDPLPPPAAAKPVTAKPSSH